MRVHVKAGMILSLAVVLTSLEMTMSASPALHNSATPAVKNGERIFAQSCSSCHAAHTATSLIGPGFEGYYTTHRPRPTDAKVRIVITQGKGTMPSFSSLGETETDELIAYLKTL